ncbi:hypothetical protein [Rhodococcus pseudokoreensis]|nr:hypothetical protein [Rhodococcus pseudokoreensis]
MPFQRGTLAWEASYHRRVGIESLCADLKRNRLDVHRGYFRGFGQPERRPRRRRRSTHSATRHATSLAATGPGR